MCKCTPEIRTPFCCRDGCLPPASREPTESLFAANGWEAKLRKERNYPRRKREARQKGFCIRPVFAWYDLWIGAFYDRPRRRLYIFPVPCFGVRIEFGARQ